MPREGEGAKWVMWKCLGDSIDAFQQIEARLDGALMDLRWKLDEAPAGTVKHLAAALQTYATARAHITLHGFPVPEIVQRLQGGSTPSSASHEKQ